MTLPIVDTHRHLGGSITPAFVWSVINAQNLHFLGESLAEVEAAMEFQEDEPNDFHRFLSKFKILDEIKWTEELIAASVRDVCEGLEREQIDYAFLDFSINKYMSIGWHKWQAIKFIYDCFDQYRPNKVGLILSLKYESIRSTQRQYARLIETSADYLVGLDLVGDEALFDAAFYAPLFKDWNAAGKLTRAHVGESQAAVNIRYAINELQVTNIAHGLKIFSEVTPLGQQPLIDLARERKVSFDMALTSNLRTGVWSQATTHPIIDMYRAGLNITLGSDDPVQCSTTLQQEFEYARTLGLTAEECFELRWNAAQLKLRYAGV